MRKFRVPRKALIAFTLSIVALAAAIPHATSAAIVGPSAKAEGLAPSPPSALYGFSSILGAYEILEYFFSIVSSEASSTEVDLAADFEVGSQVSFGTLNEKGEFVGFDKTVTAAFGVRGIMARYSQKDGPAVYANTTGGPVAYKTVQHPAGSLNLHPGDNGLRAAALFSAPVPGTYRISGSFRGVDASGTTSDATVILTSTVRDAVVLAEGGISGYGSELPLDIVVDLQANETIQFSVGAGKDGESHNDSTALAARITIEPKTAGEAQIVAPAAVGDVTARASSPVAVTSVTSDPTTGYIYAQQNHGTAFYRYDPVANVWTALATAPLNSGNNGGAAYLNGKIYTNYTSGSNTGVYDIASNSWTTITSPLGGTANITAEGGFLYLAGGTSLVRYDPSTSTSVTLGSSPVSFQPWGGLEPFNGFLYGHTGNGSSGFAKYNIATNTWTVLPSHPTGAVLGSAIDPIGNFYYAYGSYGSSDFYRFDLTSETWSPFTVAIGPYNDGGMAYIDQPGVVGIYLTQGETGIQFARIETQSPDPAPVVASVARAGANPTSAASVQFTVTFSEDVTGVDVSDFAVAETGVTGAGVTGVAGSGSVYTVTVGTGSGDGTVGLNVVDDDSIIDSASSSLGGNGTGNGDFTGELYTFDRTAPTVVSSVRNGPTPTNATSLSFTVTFSEDVTGVDAGDFSITTTGVVNGAFVSGVTPTNASTYVVTINLAGGSNGTLRLDVIDNGSINDLVGNQLGGPGAGNGGFTSGEVYTLDTTAPTAPVIAEVSNTAPVTFSVTFNEDVTGFDASDIVIGGTAFGTNSYPSAVVTGGPQVFNVAVSGMNQDGTVTINFPAGAASDLATNLTPAPAGDNSADFTLVANSVEVTPSAMAGWFYNDDGHTAGSEGFFSAGPGAQTDGSARFKLSASNQGKILVLPGLGGTRFDDFTALSYSTYQLTAPPQAVALSFNADFDLNDADQTYQGRLVFEPYRGDTGTPVADNTWQTWDTLGGRFWTSRQNVVVNGVTVPSPCWINGTSPTGCTRAELLAAFPDLGVHAGNHPITSEPFAAIIFKAGSGWASFDGSVDNFTIGINSSNTTYDFEPDGPQISVSDASVNEDAGTADFVVTLTAPAQADMPVRVDYSTADGTATAGSDYTATSGTLTFDFSVADPDADGDGNILTQRVSVPLGADTTFEPDESFTFDLSDAENGLITDSQGGGTIINDDQAPTVTIANASAGEGSNVEFTVSLSNPSSTAITVNYSVSDGTAASGSDYGSATPNPLVIAANTSSATISVPTVNDNTEEEPDETFTVTLTGTDVGSIGSPAAGTGTIVDNDDSDITIASAASATEGGSVDFTVTLSQPNSQDVKIDYTVANGSGVSGAVLTDDYTPASGSVVVPAGSTTETISISTVNDNIDEVDETFTVTLTGVSYAPSLGLGPNTTGTGTILDNDTTEVSIVASASANEGGAVVFGVTLSNPNSQNVTINYTLADVTTTPADHGSPTPDPLVITAGNTSGNISVSTVVDLDESDETFTVTLDSATNATLGNSSSTGTITDVDVPVTYVDDDWTSVADGIDPDGAGPATAMGVDAFPTVQGGVNGVSAGGTVNVYNGTYAEQVVISKNLTMDGETEAGTIIQLPASPALDPTFGEVIIYTVNGGAVVAASDLTIRGPYDTGGSCAPILNGVFVYGTATLNLSNSTVKDIRLEPIGPPNGLEGCQNGYAIAAGYQFFGQVGTVNLNQVEVPDYQKAGVYVDNAGSTATVTDSQLDGLGAAGIASYSVIFANGATGSVTGSMLGENICTAAGCGPDPINEWQGAAIGAFDSGSVTIDDNTILNSDVGVQTYATNATITNNTFINMGTQGLQLGQGTAVITGNTFSGTNGTGISVVSFLGDTATASATATKNTIAGTVTGLQLLRQESVSTLTEPEKGKGDNERRRIGRKGSRSFKAVAGRSGDLAAPTLTANYNRILSSTTAIDNPQDEVASLEFNWWGCNEGPGQPGCGTVTGSTADFDPWVVLTASATPNSIIPGDVSTISSHLANANNGVPLADSIPDAPVAFSATEGTIAPTGGTISANGTVNATFTSTSGNDATATVTVDNEAVILPIMVTEPQFSIDDVSITEGESGTSVLTFTVTKTGATLLPSSVNYATADDTATDADNDYEPVSGTLNFAASATTDTQTVSVTVNGDNVFEGNETFFVNLSSPVDAGISDAQGVGTITEDGVQPTVQFSSATFTQNETGTGASVNAVITVTRTGSEGNALTVDYSSTTGTATGGASCGAGVDYITPSGTLSWAANDTADKTFNVTVCGDINIESIETLGLALANPTGSAALGSPDTATLSIRDGNISISGTITDPSANGMGGVLVTLEGTGSSTSITTTTAANGTYIFTALRSNANYLVTPTYAATAFEPLERSFAGVTANVTNANFVGYPDNAIPRNLRFVDLGGAIQGSGAVGVNLNSTFNNVNGMTFSVDFDQSILTYQSIACGTGAPAGCSANAAVDPGSGNLAVSVDLPTGVTFAAGDRQVVRITFTNINTVPTTPSLSTPMLFADSPTSREVVGLDGNPVPSSYTNGALNFGNLEGDVSPRTSTASGNGGVTGADASQISRFAAFLDIPHGNSVTNEFQRADTAPIGTNGNGSITGADAAQARRFAAGLDPLQPAAGPGNPASLTDALQESIDRAGRNVVLGGTALYLGTPTSSPSQDVIVELLMDAQAIENSISFTLVYDPTKLQIINPLADIMLGSGAGGNFGGSASRTINRLQDGGGNDIGRVGIILGYDAGEATSAGTGKQLLRIRFRVLATATAGVTPITFEGLPPVALETAEVNPSNLVPTGYNDGGVNILPPTAASVPVQGKVTGADGGALANVTVRLADNDGGVLTSRTNSFGNFVFNGVASGRSYTMTASARGRTFKPQVITVNEQISGLTIVAIE